MTRTISASLLAGALILAFGTPALAQTGVAETGSRQTIAAPDYGSDPLHDSALISGNFATPQADGRPGVYYFALAEQAYRKGDYRHAVDMYQVSASWAYKPAEYNLALMYFRGQGVATDRARGAAWMILAAERGTPQYAHARDLMVTALNNAEFARTDRIWNELKPTYADEVALHRAKARWAQVKAGMTGSRVGDGAVHLLVGGGGENTASPGGPGSSTVIGAIGTPAIVNGGGFFKSGQARDAFVAYQQFRESDNPYDPIFRSDLTGTATVGPLMKVNDKDVAPKPKDSDVHNL